MGAWSQTDLFASQLRLVEVVTRRARVIVGLQLPRVNCKEFALGRVALDDDGLAAQRGLNRVHLGKHLRDWT